MSVKVHEPVCEDSAQDLYFWFDHFLGDQVKDEWNLTIAGGGTIAVVDAQTGGVVRLTSDLSPNVQYIDWGDIRSLHVDQKATLEARVCLSSNRRIRVIISLIFDTNNTIEFYENALDLDVNWFIQAVNGGATTSQDSGILVDTDYHIFRIECHTHGSNHAHFYIDGVETANSPLTTNIPDDAADFLQPRLRVRSTTGSSKFIDVDYVVARQDR